MFGCTDEDWRKAFICGSIEKYQQFLAGRGLPLSDNPLEATASEHLLLRMLVLPLGKPLT